MLAALAMAAGGGRGFVHKAQEKRGEPEGTDRGGQRADARDCRAQDQGFPSLSSWSGRMREAGGLVRMGCGKCNDEWKATRWKRGDSRIEDRELRLTCFLAASFLQEDELELGGKEGEPTAIVRLGEEE
ncbi:hypothetical protein LIA77_11342 [Sarocladium implicatum]|nr:hypothetical protein LIA77_11342 [Sarocladium implicatum]